MRTKMLIAMLLCVFLVGCVTSIDPVTGGKLYAVDPNTSAALQQVGEAAAGFLAIASIWWPALLPIAGYIGGAIRISKKLSPKLTKLQTEAQIYHTAALSTTLGIEEFKKLYPDEWTKLEKELDAIKDKVVSPADRLKIENLIRGLRGLPPKE